jgi:hypothetical protein
VALVDGVNECLIAAEVDVVRAGRERCEENRFAELGERVGAVDDDA